MCPSINIKEEKQETVHIGSENQGFKLLVTDGKEVFRGFIIILSG